MSIQYRLLGTCHASHVESAIAQVHRVLGFAAESDATLREAMTDALQSMLFTKMCKGPD